MGWSPYQSCLLKAKNILEPYNYDAKFYGMQELLYLNAYDRRLVRYPQSKLYLQWVKNFLKETDEENLNFLIDLVDDINEERWFIQLMEAINLIYLEARKMEECQLPLIRSLLPKAPVDNMTVEYLFKSGFLNQHPGLDAALTSLRLKYADLHFELIYGSLSTVPNNLIEIMTESFDHNTPSKTLIDAACMLQRVDFNDQLDGSIAKFILALDLGDDFEDCYHILKGSFQLRVMIPILSLHSKYIPRQIFTKDKLLKLSDIGGLLGSILKINESYKDNFYSASHITMVLLYPHIHFEICDIDFSDYDSLWAIWNILGIKNWPTPPIPNLAENLFGLFRSFFIQPGTFEGPINDGYELFERFIKFIGKYPYTFSILLGHFNVNDEVELLNISL